MFRRSSRAYWDVIGSKFKVLFPLMHVHTCIITPPPGTARAKCGVIILDESQAALVIYIHHLAVPASHIDISPFLKLAGREYWPQAAERRSSPLVTL
jgi:hypothetical protein